ncbi:MAG: CehA/McbA family metallohydrolase [Actinomycetota bacterium]
MRSALRGVLACAFAVALVVPNAPAVGKPKDKPKGQWYAGDLHVHTTYSHDSWGGPGDDNTGPEEFYTFGWSVGEQGDNARARGLDYLAITDHQDVRSTQDPAFGSEGLIWIPGYENSLQGHAQMLGIDRVLDKGASSLVDVERLAAEIRAEGGAFQINHPSDQDWIDAYGHEFVPDTVEVWNIGPWFFQHPLPSANDNDFSLRFWDAFLDAGETVAASGGSDNHWRSISAGGGVGQPTTWVFAKKPTTQGILDGLRAGRTSISHQPPAFGGPRVFLEAAEGGDNFNSIIGDSVEPGSTLRTTVEGADHATLRLVTDGSETLAQVPVVGDPFVHEIDVPEASTWVRAEVFLEDAADVRAQLTPACGLIDMVAEIFGEAPTTYCTNRQLMLALTSPIYFGVDEPEPTPSPSATPVAVETPQP